MNLKDEIYELYKNGVLSSFQYQAITVKEKEFVKQLKKELCYDWLDDTEECNRIDGCSSCKRIDKLTGFALHENTGEKE